MHDLIYTARKELSAAKAQHRSLQAIARSLELRSYYRQWDGRLAARFDAARERAFEAATVITNLEGRLNGLIHEDLNPQFA